jgi:hypothetical protein
MKPVKAWMLVCDDKPVRDGTGCPLIYGTKSHAAWDRCDIEWRIVRVEIREVERKGKRNG